MSSDVTMPASAPAATTLPAQAMPTASNATANGASRSMSPHATMPTMTTHMAAYSTAQTRTETVMPTGSAVAGSRVSSAAVATVSKPMKLKNTCAPQPQ